MLLLSRPWNKIKRRVTLSATSGSQVAVAKCYYYFILTKLSFEHECVEINYEGPLEKIDDLTIDNSDQNISFRRKEGFVNRIWRLFDIEQLNFLPCSPGTQSYHCWRHQHVTQVKISAPKNP